MRFARLLVLLGAGMDILGRCSHQVSSPCAPTAHVRVSLPLRDEQDKTCFHAKSITLWVHSAGALTRDVGSSICDVDVVIPWSKRDVLSTAASVFVISTVDLRLWRSLDSYAEPTNPCPSGKGGKESELGLSLHASSASCQNYLKSLYKQSQLANLTQLLKISQRCFSVINFSDPSIPMLTLHWFFTSNYIHDAF